MGASASRGKGISEEELLKALLAERKKSVALEKQLLERRQTNAGGPVHEDDLSTTVEVPDSRDFSTVEIPEVLALAQEAAKIIYDDMYVRCSLDAQRSRICPGLATPLPLTALDGSVENPAFMSDMLRYEGAFGDFSSLLAGSGEGRDQLRKVLAITQASGSGKTKLAYAHGSSESLMVLVRVVMQSGEPSGAFDEFERQAHLWGGVRPRLDAETKRLISQSALAALRLLVVCYVDWVSMVLAAFSEIYRKEHSCETVPTSGSSPFAAALREAALRCLRNGNGDEAVSSLYGSLLKIAARQKFVASPPPVGPLASPLRVSFIDPASVAARTVRVDNRLRSLLWPSATVVVWYDEAQALIGTSAVFMRQEAYRTYDDNMPPQDVFYGLTALMASFMDKQQWRQVVCGPWLDLSERIMLANFSCVRDRVITLHHVALIGIAEMTSSLRHVFGEDLALPEKTLGDLTSFSGRPKWFFDNFWPELWQQLKANGCKEAVPDLIANAVRLAALQMNQTADKLIQERLGQTEQPSVASPSMATLCKELYFALKLFGGQVNISRKDVARKAIFYGILALNPQQDKASVNLLSEPCIARAVERAGDELVRRSLDSDPVYQLLTAHLRSGTTLFSHIDHVKGPALELAFVWHVLRTVILHGGSASLTDVLCGFSVASALVFPLAVTDAIVTATRACTTEVFPLMGGAAGAAALGQCPDFALFSHDDADYVLFNVDRSAGADVILRTKRKDSEGHDLVLVQAKAEKESRLIEGLRSATLAWQYVEKPQRDAVMTGNWMKGGQRISNVPTAKRTAFGNLIASHPLLFRRPIRVVLTVGPFAAQTLEKCEELNQDTGSCCESPVVLCSLDAAVGKGVLPAQLISDFLDACGKADNRLKVVAHPASDDWWLPRSIKAVDDAISTRCALPLDC